MGTTRCYRLTTFLAATLVCFMPRAALAKEICVQLKWFHQSQFAGMYMAESEGYYRAEGIEVRFVEGGPAVDWQKRLADPSCQIGITNPHEIVIAQAAGINVKAVAAIDQSSPIVFFALIESGIHDPRQFKGLRIAVVPTGRIHLLGVLQKVGIGPDQIITVPFTLDMSRLYDRSVDVWSGYYTNMVTRAEQEGHPVNVIHPLDYGVQIYDDVIYARPELAAGDRALLLGFLRATLKGWAAAFRDPGGVVQSTLRYKPDANKKHERLMFARGIPYVHTGEVPIGWMEKAVWADITELTRKVGMVKSSPPAESLFDDSFLRMIYPDR